MNYLVNTTILTEESIGNVCLPSLTTKNPSVTDVFFVVNIHYQWINRLVLFLGFGLALVFVYENRDQNLKKKFISLRSTNNSLIVYELH